METSLLYKLFCGVFLTFFCLNSYSQAYSVAISGIVHDENSEPLPAIIIALPELNKFAQTGIDGQFSFPDIPTGTVSIELSSLGYHSLETKINVDSLHRDFSFTLKTADFFLDSVTVVGYSPVKLANRRPCNVKSVDVTTLHNSTTDIAHVLNSVPGARLRESGGLGSDYDFSINGFSGKRVKFFPDGVPIDNFGSSFQINNIPVNIAERPEVYKGVVPVWLGSDALGGAVNIITGNKFRNFLDVSYSHGSFNTHRTNINTAITLESGFTFQLNAFRNYSDNNYEITVDAADLYTGKYYTDTKVRRFHDKYDNKTVILQFRIVDKPWADKLPAGITAGKNYKEIQTGARQVAVFGAWHTRGESIMPTLIKRARIRLRSRLTIIRRRNSIL